MSEWTELKTLQDVAAAQARGDVIEVAIPGVFLKDSSTWNTWLGEIWYHDNKYRSRPKKRTKTIVLREALFCSDTRNVYWTQWRTGDSPISDYFVRWLDTPAREIEVES